MYIRVSWSFLSTPENLAARSRHIGLRASMVLAAGTDRTDRRTDRNEDPPRFFARVSVGGSWDMFLYFLRFRDQGC